MTRALPYLIVPLIGLSLLAVGGWFAYDTVQLRQRAERVPGTIIGMSTSSDNDGTNYAAVYGYEFEGEQRRATADVHTSSQPDVGERVTLLVDPADPNDATSENFWEQWFIAALLGGLGALFLVIGLAVGAAHRGARRRADQLPLPPPLHPDTTPEAGRHRGPFS